ncbi:MAG: serine dehydratase subunit alpha family protein [Bacillales bacterium]|nr:serine dehydratase subunit alpha family protein [Bacillales bacterium]
MNACKYEKYLEILKEEMIPALGCTEPIAIAFAAAKARDILGVFPTMLKIYCSGNIIKNVKSVVVPNTGGLKGIEVSVLAGIVGGNVNDEMEVLSQLDQRHVTKVVELLEEGICQVMPLVSDKSLHLIIEVSTKQESVTVEIQDFHTNIVKIEKNGKKVYEKAILVESYLGTLTERNILNVEDIFYFAENVEIEKIEDLIKLQITHNMAIAEEGLKGLYGINLGETLLNYGPSSIFNKIKAYTASASEARMSGSDLPVITNSGSGNQGIASSVPVIVYALEKQIEEERLIRALVLANLLTIHQKTLIGRLSAFCGVVSASCSSGAALTYLANGSLEQIKMTITNTLANVSGIVCDGAKPSCGIKIAASLDAALMAHLLALDNKAYCAGDGLIKSNIEDTISSVGRMARDGMKETDKQILEIMLEC